MSQEIKNQQNWNRNMVSLCLLLYITEINKTGTLPHGGISGFVDSAKTESQQFWSLQRTLLFNIVQMIQNIGITCIPVA